MPRQPPESHVILLLPQLMDLRVLPCNLVLCCFKQCLKVKSDGFHRLLQFQVLFLQLFLFHQKAVILGLQLLNLNIVLEEEATQKE